MRMFWVQFVAVLLASAATAAVALGAVPAGPVSTGPVSTGPVTVSQKGRAFSTSEVQIGRSGSVRFTNDDTFVHQVYVSAPGFSFESDEQLPGTIVQVPFQKSGTFVVLCHIHPKMRVAVAVQ